MATYKHTTGKRFHFIHIPRTGGRFIHENLLLNGFEQEHSSKGSIEGIEVLHFHRELYEKYLDIKDIPHIAVIRNPIDKFFSASSFFKRMYGDDIQEAMEDPMMFHSMLTNFPLPESVNWYRSQLDFISDETHLWRFEDGFKEEFASWLSDIIGVKVEMKEETQYWGQPDEGRKLKPTPKLLENVRKLYREEIEKFYPDI